ncbi:MAG TPA: transposase DNA-binding-containing protein, partial [Chloroflexota bacterium]|nr:transposase DNA-binding-containing protein [Chloroflexota bacterium]
MIPHLSGYFRGYGQDVDLAKWATLGGKQHGGDPGEGSPTASAMRSRALALRIRVYSGDSRRWSKSSPPGWGPAFPGACQDWAAVKAAYRFLSNPRVSEAEILAGHFEATRDRIPAGDSMVLV